MSKLICFETQHVAVARMLEPYVASVGELAAVADPAKLREIAKPGDTLVIATNDPNMPPSDAFLVARQAGLSVWSLSDHWVKPAAAAAETVAEA